MGLSALESRPPTFLWRFDEGSRPRAQRPGSISRAHILRGGAAAGVALEREARRSRALERALGTARRHGRAPDRRASHRWCGGVALTPRPDRALRGLRRARPRLESTDAARRL